MKRKPKVLITPAPLRRRAETQLRVRAGENLSAAGIARSTADTQRLVHELQVHQIELEMQNEELKKARDEMEAGLEKYSELYDFAPVGYLTLDREGTIREANLTAASLLAIPRAPLVKRRLALFVAPADRRLFDAFLSRVFESNERKECDVQLLVKDKPPADVRMRANLSESGQRCRLAVTDITQHKQAEAALRASEERLRLSQEVAHVGTFDWDIESGVNIWTSKLEAMYGLLPGEFAKTQRTWENLVHPDDRAAAVAAVNQTLRTGQTVESEWRVIWPDGSVHWLAGRFRAFKDQSGKPVRLAGVNIDITARKRIEEKVHISEVRYRRLFETAHDGILLLDPDTRKITDANPLMTKLLGYERDQLIGKELFEIGLLKDEAASQAMYQKLTRKHEVRYEDLPLESQGGRHQEVEVVANLYQENGHSVIQCNIRDITARKLTEEALRSAQVQLSRYAGQLEKTVARRTAELTRTNRQLVVSLDSTRIGEEQNRVLLEESRTMQKKLRRLTHQILTAQEEERKKISRELHDDVVQTLVGLNVELAGLVHGNTAGVRQLKDKIARSQRLVEKSVDSVHRFARDLRPAVLDDLGLIPALHVFCKNLAERKKLKINLTAYGGVEAMDGEKRTVLFRVAQEALANIARHARASKAEVHITKIPGAIRMEVSDNGQSFPVEKILQAKNPKRLGLVGMKERAEMVGGNLTIESVSGRGTTVRAEIPFPTPEEKRTKK